jgi:hypothetical protein
MESMSGLLAALEPIEVGSAMGTVLLPWLHVLHAKFTAKFR